MKAEEAPDLLTVKQYAKALQVTQRTVYRHIKGGTLPAVKVLGEWRIPRSAVPFGVQR